MRGMNVPPAKRRYIFLDTAREARLEGVAFGKVADPLGEATWRAMRLGFALLDMEDLDEVEKGKTLQFFSECTRAAWAEGIDIATDKGMAHVINRVNLPANIEEKSLTKEEAGERAEDNKQKMFSYGSWGVPTFRVDGETIWGQDRMWAIADALKQ